MARRRARQERRNAGRRQSERPRREPRAEEAPRDARPQAAPDRAGWTSVRRRRTILLRGLAAAAVALGAYAALPGSRASGKVAGGATAPDSAAAAAELAGWADAPDAGDGVRVPAVRGTLDAADRALLRGVFGIDDPGRIYSSDSSGAGVLLYEAIPPRCPARAGTRPAPRGCRSVAVRVGLTAPRRPDETWDAFVGRVVRSGTRAWPGGARSYYTGLASLDPAARPVFERLVADARRAGFDVSVAETYRSPERQALLLARGDGRTATATSVHSYGRAADLIIGDGLINRRATAREWIRFRRWVVRYRGGMFRVVGTPERTWDWPHVELATPVLGFRDVSALVRHARACRAAAPDIASAATRCTITPNLPPHVSPAEEVVADAR